MEKILSIIIPTYNMETLLRHTLDSLIVSDENMKILEVLVVNDGSKDSSLAIAKEYEKKYPDTIFAIDKTNGNYGSCINRGLKEASGKYVKVLDADDSLDTHCLEVLITNLLQTEVDTIITDFVIVDTNDQVSERSYFSLPTETEFTLGLIKNEELGYFWHHALIHKRETLVNINYCQTEGVSYSDDEWVYKPTSVAKSLLYIPIPLYRYLIGREGQTMSSANFSKLCIGKFKVAESIVDFYKAYYTKVSDENKHFMDAKFYERLRSLYSIFLRNHWTPQSNGLLAKFDVELKVFAPHLYYKLDDLKLNIIGYKYVKWWRREGRKDSAIFKIIRFAKKYNFINKYKTVTTTIIKK